MTSYYVGALALVTIVAIIAATVVPAQSTLIFGFAGMIAMQLLQLLKADQAAVKVEDVAKTTSDTNKQSKAIHILVNSATATLLKAYAVLAREHSDDRPEDETRAKLAREAERTYDVHMLKQDIVDRQ